MMKSIAFIVVLQTMGVVQITPMVNINMAQVIINVNIVVLRVPVHAQIVLTENTKNKYP